MSRDRRLGRGLAALLGESHDGGSEGPSAGQGARNAGAPSDIGMSLEGRSEGSALERLQGHSASSPPEEMMLLIDEIMENPFQPRRDFGEAEIASLAESLREHEMLQPVLVRKVGDRWQLISGERRLRAARRAGWKKIPVRVREADDRLVAELAIVENLQRKDLNAIEKALSFQRYLREHQCTQDDLGKRIKVDRSTIANLLRLLDLPPAIQEAVQQDRLTAGHAKALLPLGDAQQQIELCETICREQWNVREAERAVQEIVERDEGFAPLAGGGGPLKKKRRSRSDQISALEQDLRRRLGTKVDIVATSRGRGRLIIHFRNHEEFDRIRNLIDGAGPLAKAG